MQPRTKQRIERTLALLDARGPLDAIAIGCALDPLAMTSRRELRRRDVLKLLRRMQSDGLVREELVHITSTKRVVRFSRAQPSSRAL